MAAPAAAKPKIGQGARLLIGIAALAVIAVGYYFFRYNDLGSGLVIAQQREEQLHGEERGANDAFAAYTKDRNELEKKQRNQAKLNQILPETTDIASFLGDINQQAELAGLKVKTVTPADEQVQPLYTRVPVKLEFSGRFHQIAKFFAGIGRLDRVINIENIELGAPKVNDDDQTVLDGKCLATTFHANLAKPAGSAAPGAPPPGAPK